MPTERQLQANRANALKSTGPITPEGKRTSSQNAANPNPISGSVVLRGESVSRFNDLTAALTRELNPRNSIETSLVQTMAAARWHLLRIWGIQTACFELEMSAIRRKPNAPAAAGTVLAAIAFSNLADNSRALALQYRLEASCHRQFTRALATLLKLREVPDLNEGETTLGYPPIEVTGATWEDSWGNTRDDENLSEPNSEPSSEETSQLP